MAEQSKPSLVMRLPLFLMIWGVAALSMWLPAIHAEIRRNHAVSQSFFFAGLLGLVGVTLIALAMGGDRRSRHGSLGQLLVLLGTFAVLPLFLALPFFEALQTTTFLNAYFDMVSALTTTGANLFDDPARLDASLHLWRAQVGWMGGLVMWIAASAILAPLALGGFEITARGQPGRAAPQPDKTTGADPRRRLLKITVTLTPVYAGLTVVAWVMQLIAGETSLTALCHAMSVMATSGISPVGGMSGAASGIAGEMILFLFMFFALSRLTFSSDTATHGRANLMTDPEFRTGLMLILGIPLLLFLRHWLAALDVRTDADPLLAFEALWGALFTVLSFLTTTGFESVYWDEAGQWSGLNTPGLILLGLAVIGGGVATTAGGVKLLRVYALYLNGLREMERLVYPSSVSGEGRRNRRIQKNGAFVAWIFFMMFVLSLTLVSVILSALGLNFDQAIVLSVATLSTTGPLIDLAGDTPIRLVELGGWAKMVLCATMVLGRLETLAIIALITPDLWRN